MNAELRPSSRFKLQDRSGSHAPDTGAYPDGPPLFISLSVSSMRCCQTYVESSQPDGHIVSFVSWQCVPDSVVPFVHVLQRHGCVVLNNLGQGGALVEDHSKDDKLQVCSKRWISVDGAVNGKIVFLSLFTFDHLTMLISVRMY